MRCLALLSDTSKTSPDSIRLETALSSWSPVDGSCKVSTPGTAHQGLHFREKTLSFMEPTRSLSLVPLSAALLCFLESSGCGELGVSTRHPSLSPGSPAERRVCPGSCESVASGVGSGGGFPRGAGLKRPKELMRTALYLSFFHLGSAVSNLRINPPCREERDRGSGSGRSARVCLAGARFPSLLTSPLSNCPPSQRPPLTGRL